MKREIPRDPAITLHFTSMRHREDYLNHQAFQRAAQIVTQMIGNASPDKLMLLRDHFVDAIGASGSVDAAFTPKDERFDPDFGAACRALHLFFKYEAPDAKP